MYEAGPPVHETVSAAYHRSARRRDFRRGLAVFFTAADEHIDHALNTHYGFDTAVDWVICSLELHADQLT
ncbi:hypothetical protein AB0D10_32955 [Kitasatospora sp. NPDC048545]|uniref:hypothetical protein n=1 Tax=Kitasatospora sp. NPDC048545 TaxID=3157208 RepID=UPI0033E3F040